MKLPHERFEFSALPERTAPELPNGARMAVYVMVNIEEWDIGREEDD